jgi:hypothetical protein
MKELKIVLGAAGFRALVRGGEVTFPMEDGTVVKMILQDIGFSVMRNGINLAEGGECTYQGARCSPETGEELK